MSSGLAVLELLSVVVFCHKEKFQLVCGELVLGRRAAGLGMKVRLSSKFSGCSAQERDFRPNFQKASHGSAIFFKVLRMLRTGA